MANLEIAKCHEYMRKKIHFDTLQHYSYSYFASTECKRKKLPEGVQITKTNQISDWKFFAISSFVNIENSLQILGMLRLSRLA